LILLSPEAVPAVALSIVNVVGLFVLARHPTRPIHNVLAFTWSYVAWALAYSFGKQYAEKRSNERLIFSLLPRVLLAPVAGLLTLSWAIGYYRAGDIVKESHQAVIELKSKGGTVSGRLIWVLTRFVLLKSPTGDFIAIDSSSVEKVTLVPK
jgi:hypothetical protein